MAAPSMRPALRCGSNGPRSRRTEFRRDGQRCHASGGLHIGKDALDGQGPADRMAVKIINSTISGNFCERDRRCDAGVRQCGRRTGQFDGQRQLGGPTRTGGIIMTGAATYPVSGSNTARPTLTLVSPSWPITVALGETLSATGTLPIFTVNATNSLIEKICQAGPAA
jgi:hypothetical protein